MTRLLFVLLLCCTPPLYAADYYVTPAGGGDGSGGSAAHPIAYRALFAKQLQAGDRVYFHAGEVFAGQHRAQSGVSYGRYGEGATATPTKLQLPGAWRDVSGAAYSGALSLDRYSAKVLISASTEPATTRASPESR